MIARSLEIRNGNCGLVARIGIRYLHGKSIATRYHIYLIRPNIVASFLQALSLRTTSAKLVADQALGQLIKNLLVEILLELPKRINLEWV